MYGHWLWIRSTCHPVSVLELPNFYCFVVTTSTSTSTSTTRLRPGFSHDSKPPAGATRISVFFAGFIAKITLTLLADSERLPSKFRAGVADSVVAPPRSSRGRPGSRTGRRCLLFASPKRSNQEKGGREAAALRVPKSRSRSGERPQTRFPCRAQIRLPANPVTQADRMRSETTATPQTCVLLICCPTPIFGSCLNAEQVKVKVKVNSNSNSNRNRNRNHEPSAPP